MSSHLFVVVVFVIRPLTPRGPKLGGGGVSISHGLAVMRFQAQSSCRYATVATPLISMVVWEIKSVSPASEGVKRG